MVALRTRVHTARGTPSRVRSGAQKLAVEFVCRARPPRAPPRALLLQFLRRRRRELGETASGCGGAKPRRQPPNLCSRAGSAGSAARLAWKNPRITEEKMRPSV